MTRLDISPACTIYIYIYIYIPSHVRPYLTHNIIQYTFFYLTQWPVPRNVHKEHAALWQTTGRLLLITLARGFKHAAH